MKPLLGIETGGTKTIAIAADSNFAQVNRLELGPANLRLISDADFLSLLREIHAQIPTPAAIGIGLPGMRTKADEDRVLRLLNEIWPATPARVTHDLELALHAAEIHEPHNKHLPKVICLSGTGSCCYGRTPQGHSAKLGGWGHLLGDRGSGYDIGLKSARATVYYFDRENLWTDLGANIIRDLCLNEPNDLIAWFQTAEKKEVAMLAKPAFEAWAKGDRIAREVLEPIARGLAADAVKCAARLEHPEDVVQFVLAGSVLLKQPKFADIVAEQIRKTWPSAIITPLPREAAWGGVKLASEVSGISSLDIPLSLDPLSFRNSELESFLTASPTEQRNPRSQNLDKLSNREAIELFLNEESHIQQGLLKIVPQIEQALSLIVTAFQNNGRLFYVGAGTSGRLGILDASECPPTFRTPPDLVQGIIAGGQRAIWSAVEGAEDDPAAGARAIAGRNVTDRDVVIGIAASGRTPFVWGALEEASRRNAKTILLCLNPYYKLPPQPKLDLLLAADIGPELLTGSTRLKSGTATKLILNILTTLSMVRLGKVASNLMIDLNPSNIKLRARATRIVQQITGASKDEAAAALEQSGWIVKTALQNLQSANRNQ